MILTESHLVFRGIRPLQRLGETARHWAFNNPLAEALWAPQPQGGLRVVPPDPWPGDSQHGRDMIAGVFRFAGKAISRDGLSWEPADASPEWVAELHGFEWLRNLRSVGGERARRMAREMVSAWLAQYPKYHEAAWRPDILGVRLKSWISFHDFFCASADDAFRREYFSSLSRQARFLAAALPGGLSGIPLMQALKGLAYAGLALEGEEKKLKQAFSGIAGQIRAQILPDGGHVSRNPQAAFGFLQCLVDLRAAMISAKMEWPEGLQEAIDLVAPAVKFFRHGDGALAQFNGGQEGNAHLCETILMHSGARGKAAASLPHSGYERLVQGRSSLVMDTGLPADVAYSGRAHAGLLSFEYSFGRDRVIVNCGASAAEGRWRRLLRSTPAHSALVADNRNSCQFGEDGRISALPEVRVRRQEDVEMALIEAGHNGYMPRFGLAHRRCVRLREQGDVLCGEDLLTGKTGVPFAARFHLHPAIQATLAPDGGEVMLRAKSGMSWRFSASGAKLELEESVYAGRGEVPVTSRQIVLSGQTSGAATSVSWEMKREK